MTNLPNATVGSAYSFDLYAAADCGVLVTDVSGNRAKTVSITGLPAGPSYNDATGLITGTAASSFDTTVTVTITDSVGQVGVGTATFIGIVADQGTTAPTRVLRPTNQRYAAHFSLSSAQFLQATGLTLTAGGTVACIFELSSVATSQIIFERAQAASATTVNREELLGLTAGTSLAARRANATASANTAYDTKSFQPGLHLMVAVFSPSTNTINMYLDGRATPQSAGAVISQAIGLDTITMGVRQAAGAQSLPFDGYIHRVIEYPTALTAPQVEEIAVWASKNYGTLNAA